MDTVFDSLSMSMDANKMKTVTTYWGTYNRSTKDPCSAKLKVYVNGEKPSEIGDCADICKHIRINIEAKRQTIDFLEEMGVLAA